MPGAGSAGNPVEFALPLIDILGEEQNLLESMPFEPVGRYAGQGGCGPIPECDSTFPIHDANGRPRHIQRSPRQIDFIRSDRNIGYYILFPDAECCKNAIEDIVGSCGARDGIDRI